MSPDIAGKIALLFDSMPLRIDAVRYSIDLAARMGCGLIVVVVLSWEEEGATAGLETSQGLQTEIEADLKGEMEHAGRLEVAVEILVREGDPFSEVMKFLAAERMVRTIVWGGTEDLLGRRRGAKGTHWLERMKRSLGCPVVVPAVKP